MRNLKFRLQMPTEAMKGATLEFDGDPVMGIAAIFTLFPLMPSGDEKPEVPNADTK